MAKPSYQRVLLKISGEAFCGEGGRGIDTEESHRIAEEIWKAARLGVQLGVVVGGGNFVRGAELSRSGVTAATGDYMGMLGTLINALCLQDMLEKMGAVTRVATAVPVQAVAEPFIRRRCVRHLEKGRIVILAAGTGNPHFTTDTAAALRCAELGAEVLLKATKVDGVYSADPKRDTAAEKFDRLSYLDVLNQGLRVMDSTAISLCMENKIRIIVFNLKRPGAISEVICGGAAGTTTIG
jgi:uridylate kinase